MPSPPAQLPLYKLNRPSAERSVLLGLDVNNPEFAAVSTYGQTFMGLTMVASGRPWPLALSSATTSMQYSLIDGKADYCFEINGDSNPAFGPCPSEPLGTTIAWRDVKEKPTPESRIVEKTFKTSKGEFYVITSALIGMGSFDRKVQLYRGSMGELDQLPVTDLDYNLDQYGAYYVESGRTRITSANPPYTCLVSGADGNSPCYISTTDQRSTWRTKGASGFLRDVTAYWEKILVHLVKESGTESVSFK